jgi:endonuclease/exonuclease/phosphatase family metal-dependent hydrolase
MMNKRSLVVGLILSLALLVGCAANPPKIRVLTYNIHHAVGTDGRLDLARLAKVIKQANPDFVALQEVDQGTRRAGGVRQADELGRLTGLQSVFSRSVYYDGGEYGNAILSRFKLELSQRHELPGTEEREPRTALSILVHPTKRSKIRFVDTHLDHQIEVERISQAHRLNELFHDDLTPLTILAGDLNAQPGSKPVKILQDGGWQDTTGDTALSFPAPNPDRKIDWIFTGPAGKWHVLHTEVINEPVASDHRPVLVELEWKVMGSGKKPK